jgi:hypothetical protein
MTTNFHDLRVAYLELVRRVDAQLTETSPTLPAKVRTGFAAQIASASIRHARGGPISEHLHEVAGHGN